MLSDRQQISDRGQRIFDWACNSTVEHKIEANIEMEPDTPVSWENVQHSKTEKQDSKERSITCTDEDKKTKVNSTESFYQSCDSPAEREMEVNIKVEVDTFVAWTNEQHARVDKQNNKKRSITCTDENEMNTAKKRKIESNDAENVAAESNAAMQNVTAESNAAMQNVAAESNAAMHSLGSCCGRKMSHTIPFMYCDIDNNCRILAYEKYYSYKYFDVCDRCFCAEKSTAIKIGSNKKLVKKSDFKEMINNEVDEEPLTKCAICHRQFHNICVMHLDANSIDGYICMSCHEKHGTHPRNPKYTAASLPATSLGSFLENRVESFLERNNVKTGRITIRVLSISDKYATVCPSMMNLHPEIDSYPYRLKVISVFQEINGSDVLIFVFRVHEYGSECKPPNTRLINLEYIDSVNFFEPRVYRTAVYQNILGGYLDYARTLGYSQAFIWTCPPPQGDSHIFNIHPPEQKMPDIGCLVNWYKNFLNQAKEDGIITGYNSLYEEIKKQKYKTLAQLPYFESLSSIFEDTIKEWQTERKSKRKKKKYKSPFVKARHIIEFYNEEFLIIKLNTKQPEDELGPIIDQDSPNQCPLVESRWNFISTLRDRNWEFSTLRHAKYSTKAILYELHHQNEKEYKNS